MQPWTVERGTLWTWEATNGLPPACLARVAFEFGEVQPADVDELAAAMKLPTLDLIQERLRGGRRCFSLRTAGRLVSYGWVTRGGEYVGELERQFHLHDDEAYIWDCGTVPARRGQRLYSALLSKLIYHLHAEGVPRIWIGASRQNLPSIRGFANAGFIPVVDLTYRRYLRLTLTWIRQAPATRHQLTSAAYRVLLNSHERRFGQLFVGYLL